MQLLGHASKFEAAPPSGCPKIWGSPLERLPQNLGQPPGRPLQVLRLRGLACPRTITRGCLGLHLSTCCCHFVLHAVVLCRLVLQIPVRLAESSEGCRRDWRSFHRALATDVC